jgi:raffinose/stachyose/melibiose transport system permease protein
LKGEAKPVSNVSASRSSARAYPLWFHLPAAFVFATLFLLPSFAAVFFSLTRWSLSEYTFIGLDNYAQFFREPFLVKGVINTLIYAVVTSGFKVVLGLMLGVLLTSKLPGRDALRAIVFFPVLVSTVGVGITFSTLMHPTNGLLNVTLSMFGVAGPAWLTNPKIALLSVAFVDIWKGVGLATVIYIAGLVSIPREYYEASTMDGAGAWQRFREVTLPLVWPATSTVIILSFIGGLRSFDLIWSMTRGGPGFTTDVIASVIYKQYQAGFYGLSTAGNVVLFALVAVLILPLSAWFNRREIAA